MLLLGLLFFGVMGLNLGVYTGEYDEGPTLQAALLLGDGYRLYEEIVYNKPPLLIWWLSLWQRWGGPTLEIGELAIAWFTFLGYCAWGALAARWFNPWAGPLAMVFVFGAPDLVARMLAVTNELPALAMCCWSMLFITRVRRSRPWVHVCLAGIAFGLALGLHPLTLYAAAPLVLLIALHTGKPTSWRPWVADFLRTSMIFAGAAVATILLWLTPVYGAGFVRWVISYNAAPLGPGLSQLAADNAERLIAYLWTDYRFYTLPFVLALITLIAKRATRPAGLAMGVWTAGTIITLTTLEPMWDHYMVILLPPLIIGLGGGVALGLQSLARHRSIAPWVTAMRHVINLGAATGLMGIAIALTMLRHTWPEWPPSQVALSSWIAEQVGVDEFVAVDDPLAAYIAGRRVPPQLADSSEKRISTGYLDFQDVISALIESRVRYLIFANERFARLDDLEDWASAYGELYESTEDYEIYAVFATHTIEIPMSADLGDRIRFLGYTLDPGPPLTITLFWQALGPLTETYHIFFHVTDTEGNLIAALDNDPLDGALQTPDWPEYVTIPHTIELTNPLPAGTYRLSTGMYSYPDLTRLPITSAGEAIASPEALYLTTLDVEP